MHKNLSASLGGVCLREGSCVTVGAVHRMTAAVERGSLHRIEIKPHRTLLASKVYSRGSHGPTIA